MKRYVNKRSKVAFGDKLRYSIEELEDPILREHTLAKAHSASHKVLCFCNRNGIELKIVQKSTGFYLRTPQGTAHLHYPTCHFYSHDKRSSGRRKFLRSALSEHRGKYQCRLEFVDITSPSQAMNMHSLLHLIVDHAGLTYWHPNIGRKRNLNVVLHFLDLAAQNIRVLTNSLKTEKPPLHVCRYTPEQSSTLSNEFIICGFVNYKRDLTLPKTDTLHLKYAPRHILRMAEDKHPKQPPSGNLLFLAACEHSDKSRVLEVIEYASMPFTELFIPYLNDSDLQSIKRHEMDNKSYKVCLPYSETRLPDDPTFNIFSYDAANLLIYDAFKS